MSPISCSRMNLEPIGFRRIIVIVKPAILGIIKILAVDYTMNMTDNRLERIWQNEHRRM